MTQTIRQIDLDKLREETPGVRHCIHLNNAGAALMPTPVIEAVMGHFKRESEIGAYEAANEASTQLATVHGSVARLIGANADEIAITENATVAWQRALQTIVFVPGDRILTTRAEFASNYIALLQIAARSGASVEVIPDNENGALDPLSLAEMIDGSVRLIAITWLPTNGGLVNPAAEVGRIARSYGIPYLLDACQAVGQMVVDVKALGCDMLTATGRKFLRAPRGTGFLYMNRATLAQSEPATLDLFGATVDRLGHFEMRADARRFETWETNYATRLGLGAAAEYACGVGIDLIEARCLALAGRLRESLAEIGVVKQWDMGNEKSAIISFTVNGGDVGSIMQFLTERQINVSISPPTSTPIDAASRGLPYVLRASPHYYNTDDEIDSLIIALRELPTRLAS